MRLMQQANSRHHSNTNQQSGYLLQRLTKNNNNETLRTNRQTRNTEDSN